MSLHLRVVGGCAAVGFGVCCFSAWYSQRHAANKRMHAEKDARDGDARDPGAANSSTAETEGNNAPLQGLCTNSASMDKFKKPQLRTILMSEV